ncbi:MAG TPA: MBL fold metallo-hydrolase, partial [Alcanivorax sp.]|nr:MBL fold metallo-hydrolase [Alcanivorax sp.]
MSPSAAGIPQVESFFDPVTNTVSYVVIDPQSRRCALVDSVLDYDAASGHTSYAGAQKLVDFVRAQNLTV